MIDMKVVEKKLTSRVTLLFAWYDLWIGVFVDKPKRKLYIFPIPTIGFVIKLPEPPKQ